MVPSVRVKQGPLHNDIFADQTTIQLAKSRDSQLNSLNAPNFDVIWKFVLIPANVYRIAKHKKWHFNFGVSLWVLTKVWRAIFPDHPKLTG